MSKLVVVPNKKEFVKDILNKDIDGLILGVDNLSIYDVTFSPEEIIKIASSTSKEITIAINKMIHNDDIPLVKEALQKLNNSNIKKILFYDMGIFNIIKKMGIKKELVLGQEHLNLSTYSNNFYYKEGISNTFISSDVTYSEVLEIKNNTKMTIYYTVYGYLPIFYSRRNLISNYFKYIEKDMKDDKYYIFNNNLKYLIKEREYGTIIYSSPINLINELDKINDIDYLVIDLSFMEDIDIIDKFINREKIEDTYLGFFDTKTIYKLKGSKGDKQ